MQTSSRTRRIIEVKYNADPNGIVVMISHATNHQMECIMATYHPTWSSTSRLLDYARQNRILVTARRWGWSIDTLWAASKRRY